MQRRCLADAGLEHAVRARKADAGRGGGQRGEQQGASETDAQNICSSNIQDSQEAGVSQALWAGRGTLDVAHPQVYLGQPQRTQGCATEAQGEAWRLHAQMLDVATPMLHGLSLVTRGQGQVGSRPTQDVEVHTCWFLPPPHSGGGSATLS